MIDQAIDVHRLHFAFTATFHYIFPQLTMGLALLILYLKTKALRTSDDHYDRAARFWARIFAINFTLGVVTGIPMEFQFGTNWAVFSRTAGGVIGQTLAMEGVFSFFLESSFIGLFLFGEKQLGPVGHWLTALFVWLGSWLSGFFIVATDAWMQHPVGYTFGAQGQIELASFWDLVLNRWAWWQYAHTMLGAVQTGCFAMAGLGALYLLLGRDEAYGKTFVGTGVAIGTLAAFLQLFPSGDQQGRLLAQDQPVTLAAVEGLFESQRGAPLAILGQPNVRASRKPLRNSQYAELPDLSALDGNGTRSGPVPVDVWPDRIALLYYSYHVMVGLGTIFIAVMAVAAFLLWRGTLFSAKWMLWILMISTPFPYIANTAGWLTAELGRQPWLVFGLLRTSQGVSPSVEAGSAWFTLLGFMGMYALLSMLFLFLVWRQIAIGPEGSTSIVQGPMISSGTE